MITGKPCGNGCGYTKKQRKENYAKNDMKLSDMKREQNKNVWLYDMWNDKGEKWDQSGRNLKY